MSAFVRQNKQDNKLSAAKPIGKVPPIASRKLRTDAFISTIAVAIVLSASMQLLASWQPVHSAAYNLAFLIYAVTSAFALGSLHYHPHDRFGLANIITLVRAAITSAFGGLVLTSSLRAENQSLLWATASTVAVALILDGIDGFVARRTGKASPFGSRFDVEIDTLMILFLSIAVLLLHKAGGWVILIGLMRYGHIAAQAIKPALRAEMHPSIRRKAIWVLQGPILCLTLLPVVQTPYSNIFSIIALIFLAWSLVVDIIFQLEPKKRYCVRR
ncbi:CDP-alcohol phosphatidyltransferase family protein [Rhizobium terrae]|uniref:CDP-alcohol phosphatidyltransferase family protein n=1 Tax=Rhizobium terrae TaxID=2171756 RepID=UPI000E3CF442|nr:CDP-alcohol phosphatidyltransferase family protein [Rhizobium terrae]